MLNKKNELVSVIIPVYNVEKYLSLSLESVISQSYYNIEIILVDDGSNDKSGVICDEYEKKDERIKVLHTINGGAATARNVGIKCSHGKYICFVDADDIISNDYIEYLVGRMEEFNLDIMICGYKKVYQITQCTTVDKQSPVKIMAGAEALEDMLYRKKLTAGPCYKIVVREIVENNKFPEARLYEDLGCVYKWFASANRVGYSEKVGYFYFMRENSCQHSEFCIKKWDLIEFSKEIQLFVENNFPEQVPASMNRLFVSAIQLLKDMPKKQFPDKYLQLIHIIKETRKEVVLDKKAKSSTRFMALLSYFNINFLSFMGRQYSFWIDKLKIRMKY